MSESVEEPAPRRGRGSRSGGRKRRPQRRPVAKRKGRANPFKWVVITGLSLLVILFVVLIVVVGGINSWLKGDGFRDWAGKTIATVLKSEAQFESLEWRDSEVYVDGFRANGYEDAGFASLELDGVRALFDGIGGSPEKAWQVPETTMNRLNLEFSRERLRGEFAKRGTAVHEGDGKSAAPSWLRNLLPSRVDVGEVRIDAGNVTIRDAAGGESMKLTGVRAKVDPDLVTAMWDIGGQGGKLVVAGAPPFDVQQFGLRWQKENLYITELALNFLNGAHLSGTGDVLFGEGAELNLDLDVEHLDMHEVISDPTWRDRLSGTIEGDVRITGTPGSKAGLVQSGTIRIKDGVVTSMAFLDTVATYTRTEQFKRLGLNQASADFVRQGDRIHFKNIKVQSDGLTRIEGEMLIEGEKLAGIFQLGVTPGTLRWIPGADRKVFVDARDGFLWAPLQITGTFDDVNEDLTARLIAAAGEAFVEDLPRNVIEKAREAAANPIEAPSNLIDQGLRGLESLIPLIGN